jgi:hypothetical protein
METILILYAIGASALVIWSTLRSDGGIRQRTCQPTPRSTVCYIAIPNFLLHEWTKCYSDLVIFDLCPDSTRRTRRQNIPGSIRVVKDELPNLLKWLPPKSTVVFSGDDSIRPLGAQIESTLLQLGIEAIYLLDDGVRFPLTVTWERRPLATGG